MGIPERCLLRGKWPFSRGKGLLERPFQLVSHARGSAHGSWPWVNLCGAGARGDQGRPTRARRAAWASPDCWKEGHVPLGPCPAAPAGKEWGSPEGLGCGGLLIMEVHRLNIKPRTPSVPEIPLLTDAGHSTKDADVPTQLPAGEGRQLVRKVRVTPGGPAPALFSALNREPGGVSGTGGGALDLPFLGSEYKLPNRCPEQDDHSRTVWMRVALKTALPLQLCSSWLCSVNVILPGERSSETPELFSVFLSRQLAPRPVPRESPARGLALRSRPAPQGLRTEERGRGRSGHRGVVWGRGRRRAGFGGDVEEPGPGSPRAPGTRTPAARAAQPAGITPGDSVCAPGRGRGGQWRGRGFSAPSRLLPRALQAS